MSEPTRVIVLAQDAATDVPAGCPAEAVIALLESETLTVVASPGSGASRRIALPAAKLNLARAVESGSIGDWTDLRADLCGPAGTPVLVICPFDHPLKEVLLLWSVVDGFRYALYFTEAPARFSVADYALLGSAAATVHATPEIQAQLQSKYIGPLRQTDAADLVAAAPAVTPDRAVPDRSDQRRLLLVSYFSGPCRSVGVQRPNYWFDAIGDITDGRYEVHLATATQWDQPTANLHYVPDLHTACLAGPEGAFPDWAVPFVRSEQKNARAFNTMSHYWQVALERYFDQLDLAFDAVVVTGNPFSVFDFTRYAKARWYARTVLDYRDPFANNPRMKFAPEARDWARYIEKGFNLQSDLAVVVNEDCRQLLVAGDEIETAIVPNGFDDRILSAAPPPVRDDEIIKIAHAGQFYSYGSPAALIGAMTPGRHAFHHIGNAQALPADVLGRETVVAHGRKPYADTLGLIAAADCGVVFLSEEGFETSTKIFDYLAAGIDVLVCTAGDKRDGPLADLLEGRDGVYWCRNDPEDIAGFLADYTPTRDPVRLRQQGARFSRRHSTEVLIDRIDRLLASMETTSAA